MKKVIINVLASDFIGNKWMNTYISEEGCPLMRGLFRSGVGNGHNYLIIDSDIKEKVELMFKGEILIEDFSFELKITE